MVFKVLKGEISKEKAQQEYDIGGKSLILDWIRNFEEYGACSLKSARKPLISMPKKTLTEKPLVQLELEARIKLLEQRLEDEKHLKEMYSRMIEIAEQEYNIPIRKKPNTK